MQDISDMGKSAGVKSSSMRCKMTVNSQVQTTGCACDKVDCESYDK